MDDDTLELTSREAEQLMEFLIESKDTSLVQQRLGRVSKLLLKENQLNPILHRFSVSIVFPSLQGTLRYLVKKNRISSIHHK